MSASALPRTRHRTTALAAVSLVFAMGGLSFAAVPLYGMFCRATGYGGTTQVAGAGPRSAGHRTVTVRFDANVLPGLPWTFAPETPSIEMRTGTTATVYFRVRNLSGRDTAGRAQYNVTPDVSGFYFNKVSCFCFDVQKLDAGETAELPVVFFLDPALEKDRTMNNVDTLTLSYTFAAVKAVRPAAAAADAATRAVAVPKL